MTLAPRLILTLLCLPFSVFAGTETYSFKIRGSVDYRSNGETFSKIPLDEIIKIKLEGEKNLEGSWEKHFEYKGRKFSALVNLSKEFVNAENFSYLLQLEASDNEKTSRSTTTRLRAKRVKDFNTANIQYHSLGQPQEIDYSFTIEPQVKSH